ncbi:ATP-grasp domain-containing protein [Schleiferiaceae bacterium]|nr:ATP-grasp domain-containing protein [Schleiferiaceae bacterium]
MIPKIIVLGGSYLQVSFIQRAEKLGYHVLVLDGNAACYCARFGIGEFHHLDFAKKEVLRNFYNQVGAISIFAPVNEFGNVIASDLAQELGYNYNRSEVVKASGDKKLFWEKLVGLELAKPRSYNEKDLSKDSLPVIIKPTISTSSKGVSLVTEEQEINEAIMYARQSGKNQEIRIEEYIGGFQYSLETLTVNGRHFIIGVIEEHLSEAPYFFERSDIFNLQEQEEKKEFFIDFVKLILDRFGVEVGPCHIEVKVLEGKIYLIDFATRSGGWRDMMLMLAGIDYNKLIVEAYIKNSVKEISEVKALKSVGAAILNYHEDLLALKRAQKMGLVKEVHFNGQVPKLSPRGLNDAFGYYFITADTKEDLVGLLPTY